MPARQHSVKLIIDYCVAGSAVIVLSPVIVATALLVRVILGSPVIFAQTRPGLGGRPFRLYKFRTMSDARDPAGELLPDADRLGPFGRWLRKWSLDELPQLVNVLKGELSLVGPRPLLMEYLPLYSRRQATRHDVKPGITGWAQVNGRNAISWPEKLELDAWYVEHRSLLLDAKILWMTLMSVIRGEGITLEGEATTVRFRGNE